MMEHRPLDPYEQQLLKVFDSYDNENCGSLDREGLTQLCRTLQLEEHGTELVKCLLKDPKSSRATFSEFKDALLALLGNMQNSNKNADENTVNENDKGSPDREVSPKFVYGSKKYGRRSRPRCDELTIKNPENDVRPSNGVPVQRSNSQSDVSYSKKRKTNYQLKRCTSLPGSEDFAFQRGLHHNGHAEGEFVCTEEMLREAWSALGVGEDGFLNRAEILVVCDAIGLRELAKGVIRQLKDKLSADCNRKISFQELLEALQQDDTWTEVLGGSPCDVGDGDSVSSVNMSRIAEDSILMDSQVSLISLGPQANGTVDVDAVIEMWENAGVTSPKLLLSDLGFTAQRISVAELANVLDREIKGVCDSDRADLASPHVTLLQANLALYQSEIRCLRAILEQTGAEREKLRCDVFEANNRATLLAQEVDDNHARMEKSSQNQVRLLEQRHADVLRGLTEQFAGDKEQAALVNRTLEQKIACLETEEHRLRNDLALVQTYSTGLEKENLSLNQQLSELHQLKSGLSERIGVLENERQKYMEIEKIEPLLAKLAALQSENSQLRDRNDEMVSEIENLSGQLNSLRAKMSSTPTFNTLDQSMEENISIICEGVVGLGSKRRSDESPSKEIASLGIGDGSPRLGKVRKYQKSRDAPDAPFMSSESGFDTEIDESSSLSVSANDGDEVAALQAKVKLLEQALRDRSIPVPTFDESEGDSTTATKLAHLKTRCCDLEKLLAHIRTSLASALTNRNDESLLDTLQDINDRLDRLAFTNDARDNDETDACTEADDERSRVRLEDLVGRYEAENRDLAGKCDELEKCVELLRNEYEKCEDYWATKLDEERQMFESEQLQNGEKLNELVRQMNEYEEQFASQLQEAAEKRLPPIEENVLERQFTDLEQEYDDYKSKTEATIGEKDVEITVLKEKLAELAKRRSQVAETAVQVDFSRTDCKLNNLSNHVVESTNLFSADALPFNCQEENEFIWNNKSRAIADTQQTNVQPFSMSLPSTSSTPCRPKRARKYDHRNNSVLAQRMQRKGQCSAVDEGVQKEQTCVLPVSTVCNLNGRLHHLEQRCRHLQVVLKQQHYCAEQMLHSYWQQYKGENAELQYLLKNSQEKLEQQTKVCNEQLDKLVRADMLVKDLYIENSYLVANVQRLEQQCHMLAQCNSNSSSM